jgi:Flp pilus assembly protein TadG
MRRTSIRRHSFSAQGIVEFALISPMLILLILGVFEGARLAYAYNTINHAAQEAGRQAVLSNTASVEDVKLRAVDAADPLSVSADLVTVEVNEGATAFESRTMGDRMRVTVSYEFVPVASMVFGGKSGISLAGVTELMVE